MYKLLVVDDKPVVVEGLRHALDWDACGIQLVGSALDGLEGVEMAKNRKPDLIITDIKMPGMDGLDMIRRIQEFLPNVHFLVISGFDEFGLAKKAFQYGAVDYLVKPVDLEQLKDALNKITGRLSEQEKEEREKRAQNEKLRQGRESILENAVRKLFNGAYECADTIGAELNLAGVSLDDTPFAVLTVHHAAPDGWEGDTQQTFWEISRFLESSGIGYGTVMEPCTFGILVTASGLQEIWLWLLGEHLYSRFLKEGDAVGIGSIGRGLEKVKHAYIRAERAAQYRYLQEGPVVVYSQIREKIRSLQKAGYPAPLVGALVQALKLCDRVQTQAKLQQYFAEMRRSEVDIFSLGDRILEMLVVVKKELLDVHFDLSQIFPNELEQIDRIREKGSIQEMEEETLAFFGEILDFFEKTAKRENRRVVQEVLRIIDERFPSPELSVAEAAGRVFLTPNYLSSLVKQVTGETFGDIVVKKRIERAKGLLCDPTLKTYEIAQMVGYANANYFSSSFRKIVGLTPAEFRDQFCG